MSNEMRAVTYKGHIGSKHYGMTGEELAFNKVPCPTCSAILVKRIRKGTDIFFVACDKTGGDKYCPFSIGMDETLEERSRRIFNKFRRDDIIDMVQPEPKQLGRSVILL